MKYKGLLSLKIWIMITFVAVWNIGFLCAMKQEPESGQSSMPRESALIIAATCFLASVFALTVAASKKAQSYVLAEKRLHLFASRPFYLVSIVTGVLALGSFTF